MRRGNIAPSAGLHRDQHILRLRRRRFQDVPVILRDPAIMIAILSYPIFLLMGSGNDTYIILAQVLMMSLNAGFMAPANVVLMGLFPPQTRYSGMAFGYSVGVAVTGGFTPAFATYLVHVTGNIYAPGYMLLGAAVEAMIVVYQARNLMRHTKDPSRALIYG